MGFSGIFKSWCLKKEVMGRETWDGFQRSGLCDSISGAVPSEVECMYGR